MPEPVLTLLKFCLVAVLYLFFFRVLRAVWAELRQPEAAPVLPAAPRPAPARAAPAPAPAASPTRPGWLRVVRPPTLSGTSFQLVDHELVVGRAPGSAVLLDDPTVSSRHARVFPQHDSVLIDDLGSRNGTLVNGRRIDSPTRLSTGDRLSIGPNVELEVLP